MNVFEKDRYIDFISIKHHKEKAKSLDAFLDLVDMIYADLESKDPTASRATLLTESLKLAENILESQKQI